MKPVRIRDMIEGVIGVPIPVIKDCISRNEDVMRQEWNSLNPQTPRDVRRFYSEGHGMLWNMLAASGLDADGTDVMVGSPFNLVASRYPKGKVLDYGCGLGRYGLIFSNFGWEVSFADVVGHAYNFVKKWITLQEREGVSFLDISVDDDYAELDEEMYDVVVNMDLLEHVPDPEGMLRFLVNRLYPNGLLLMEVFFDNLSKGGTVTPMAPYHLKENFERYNDRVVWSEVVRKNGLEPIWWDENKIPKIYMKVSV